MNKNIKTQERKRQRTWADSSQKKKQTFLKHLERCSGSLHWEAVSSLYTWWSLTKTAHKTTGNGNCHSPAMRGQHRETLREVDKITPVTDVFILSGCTFPSGTASQRCPCSRTRHQTHRAFTSHGVVHCVWQGRLEDAHPGACPNRGQEWGWSPHSEYIMSGKENRCRTAKRVYDFLHKKRGKD